jgi:hypothetical protein
MNIFVLSRNVRSCARMHCDRHVVKMPLETAQLLSTALYLADPPAWEQLHAAGQAYKPSHQQHPCALWTRASINNYLWLCRLGIELCEEYSYRFGERGGSEEEPRRHKSAAVIRSLREHAPLLPKLRHVTDFATVVPDDCQVGDAVLCYREYYLHHKSAFARWTKRAPPAWFAEAEHP